MKTLILYDYPPSPGGLATQGDLLYKGLLHEAVETAAGLLCEVRYQPLSPAGLYIPGGSAPLVSTVLMLAIPASIAGCSEIVMCSPPGPGPASFRSFPTDWTISTPRLAKSMWRS